MRKFLFITFLIVAIGLLLYGTFKIYEEINRVDYNPENETTSQKNAKSVPEGKKVFETEFFKFETNNSWQEVGSTGSTFSYRSSAGSNLAQTLTIAVNSNINQENPNRILPIQQKEDLSFEIGEVSEPCGTKTGLKKQIVVIDEVKFDCFGDDTLYRVMVGLKRGSTQMSLARPGGGHANYQIYYLNSDYSAKNSHLKDIMNTFVTR